ncbi:MAG: OadG family protein [Lachnospiraceae bacterium]|nr:OadG family protein [Lachnospiraceae bacterium]
MLNFVVAASDISIGEALGNMVVGLGVVFAALLFLCGIISLFKFIAKWDKSSSKAPAKAPVKAAPAAPAVKAAPKAEEGIDGTVLAVILAAVAEKCGPNARITSIQKSK